MAGDDESLETLGWETPMLPPPRVRGNDGPGSDQVPLAWGEPSPSRAAAEGAGRGAGSATFATLSDLDWADSFDSEEETTSVDPEAPSLPEEVGAGEGGARYERLELLGKGGMGEVWRVHDRELNRTVAMKVLRPKLLLTSRGLARFREEAQVASQLQHPGIIPIHDLGRLPDGRVWFTMKEVRGRTLEQLLQDFHEAHRAGARGGLSLRRLVDAFHRVCETVAYAHARGVIHRDLKPANIMVGDFGEVLVLDWGLAKVLATEASESQGSLRDFDRVATTSSLGGPEASRSTRIGAVTGTPAYMAPEQARGQHHKLGPGSDVYALGATLYDVLAERPPYLGTSVRDMLDQVMATEPILPPSAVTSVNIDEELDRITMRALAARITDRYATAGELARDLAAWLDGARKRERAMALVEQAEQQMAEADRAEREAASLHEQAERALRDVAATAPEEQKWPGWALEDDAADAARRAARTRAEATQLLRSALSHAPDLDEAHQALADTFHRQHRQLEVDGHDDEARVVEVQLSAHDRGTYAAYLEGTGAVTLITDPEGAEVDLYRFELVRRRLQPVFVRSLGRTPLVRVSLAMGSYLLKIRAPGRQEVLYPVFITRQEHWHGVAPGEREPRRIWLPEHGALDADDCYVPAGWFWAGHRTEANALPWGKRWVEGFVMRRYPVTNAEYMAVLEHVLATEGEEAALALVPVFEVSGEPHFALEAGRFVQRPDGDGSLPTTAMPTYAVTFELGRRFARAYGVSRAQIGWDLPSENQWERAARGADGRAYVFGATMDPTWAWTRSSWTGEPEVAEVGRCAFDRSPFGVCDLTGNLADWVVAGDEEPVRGGAWNRTSKTSSVYYRWSPPAGIAGANIGVRLARGARIGDDSAIASMGE